MSTWKSFPEVYRKKRPSWTFRSCSKLWFTDRFFAGGRHDAGCRCGHPDCFESWDGKDPKHRARSLGQLVMPWL